MRISDWSSDVCSSDLLRLPARRAHGQLLAFGGGRRVRGTLVFKQRARDLVRPHVAQRDHHLQVLERGRVELLQRRRRIGLLQAQSLELALKQFASVLDVARAIERSEEHTSELQSLMRISYAVLRLKKKN